MAGEGEILRTYYYACLPYRSRQPSAEETERFNRARSFHTALEMLPRFEVRQGRLEFRGHNSDGQPIFVQKRVDIMLAVDMVQLATKGHISQITLMAGDSDFIPAISVAKAEGVLIRLFHGQNCHADLQRSADERVQIDQQFLDFVRRS